LTPPETISHLRDTVGAHQNLNGAHNLTTPAFQRYFAIRWLALATFNLPKFEVSISTHYADMKGDTKCRKWDG